MDYDFTCENVTVVDGVSFEYQFGVKNHMVLNSTEIMYSSH